MILIFNPSRLSRSINRKEWNEIWRWKRVTERQLARSISEQMQLLGTYGTTMPEYMRRDMIDKLIYPLICVYPKPANNQPLDIHPGAINYIR